MKVRELTTGESIEGDATQIIEWKKSMVKSLSEGRECKFIYENVDLPVGISNDMMLWRNGLGSLPRAYIEFHRILAKDFIDEMEYNGLVVHRTWMDRDDYGDSMRLMYAIVEDKKGLHKLKWCDGYTQKWYELSFTSGAWLPYSLN